MCLTQSTRRTDPCGELQGAAAAAATLAARSATAPQQPSSRATPPVASLSPSQPQQPQPPPPPPPPLPPNPPPTSAALDSSFKSPLTFQPPSTAAAVASPSTPSSDKGGLFSSPATPPTPEILQSDPAAITTPTKAAPFQHTMHTALLPSATTAASADAFIDLADALDPTSAITETMHSVTEAQLFANDPEGGVCVVWG